MKTLQITLDFGDDSPPISGIQVPRSLFGNNADADGLAYLFSTRVINGRASSVQKNHGASTPPPLTITISHSHVDNLTTQEEIAIVLVEFDVFLRANNEMKILVPAIPSALFIIKRAARLYKEYKDVIDFIQRTEIHPDNWKLLTLAPALNKLGDITIRRLEPAGIFTLGQLMERHHWNEEQNLRYMNPRNAPISKIDIIETLRLLASFYDHEELGNFIIQLTGARAFEASSSIVATPPNAAPINSGLISSFENGALPVNTQAGELVNQALQNEIIQLKAMMNKSFAANKAYARILFVLLEAYQQQGVASDYIHEVIREINAEITRAEGTDTFVSISPLDNMLRNLAQGRGPNNNSVAGFQPTLFSPAPEGDRDLNGEGLAPSYFNP